MFVKHGVGGRGAGSQRGRTSEGHVDKTQRLFRKYSGGDDQMDAAEFADSLKEILGKGTVHDRTARNLHERRFIP